MNKKKTCAIVGNAQSIFNEEEGHLIDACDVVVRINRPEIKSPKHQGTKTNYMFVFKRTLSFIPKDAKYVVINLNTEMRDVYFEWCTRMEQELNVEKARPTTGFMAIIYMFNLDYDIKLFGFDWYKTKTHYNTRRMYWHRHYPEWEKETIEKLLKGTPSD